MRPYLAAAGIVCLVLAGMLIWKRKDWRRTQALLMFLGGILVNGGWLGKLRLWLIHQVNHASTWSTGKIVGTAYAISWAIALIFTIWLALEMDLDGLLHKLRPGRRGGRSGSGRFATSAATPWVALITALLIVSLPGGPWIAQHIRSGIAAVRDA